VHEFRKAHRRRWVAFRRLQYKRVAAGERHRKHPHRNHDGEIERRDAGSDTQRLAQAEGIDARTDALAEFALEQVRRAAGELHDLEAARDFATRIADRLAVFTRE